MSLPVQVRRTRLRFDLEASQETISLTMTPTDYREVAATSYPTNGSSALTPSFSSIQRNRGSRFEMDLSSATVVGCLQAYEARMQKRNPRYSAGPAIAILRDIEEHERMTAETSLDANGQPMQWAGPFMPLDICSDFWGAL